MESIVVDDDVTSILAGCCLPVCSAMAEESDPRPTYTAAVQASEQRVTGLVVIWQVGLACRVSPLAAKLSVACTVGLKVGESLKTCGSPCRSFLAVFLKFGRV